MTKEEWIAKAKTELVSFGLKEDAASVAEAVYDTYHEEYPDSPEEGVMEELSNWGD